MNRQVPIFAIVAWIALAGVLCLAWAAWPSPVLSILLFVPVVLLPRRQFNGRAIARESSRVTNAFIALAVLVALAGIATFQNSVAAHWLHLGMALLVLALLVLAGYRIFLQHKTP